MAIAITSVSLILIVLLLAWKKGGAPERYAVLILLAMAAADPIVHLIADEEYGQVDLGHLAIDLSAWAAFFIIALKARRFWPLCASSLQTIALLAHATRALDVNIDPLAYAIMKSGSFYAIILLILVGSMREGRRRARNINGVPWRT